MRKLILGSVALLSVGALLFFASVGRSQEASGRRIDLRFDALPDARACG